MIDPVYNRYQQKNIMFTIIQDIFFQAHKRNFAELFGGTGFISINMKALTPPTKLLDVNFNDYDNLIPVNEEKARHNWSTWQGVGKSQSKYDDAMIQKRLDSNKWQERIHNYNLIADTFTTYHDRSYRSYDYNDEWFLYLDPPAADDNDKYAMSEFDHLALLRKIRVWDKRGCKFLLTYPLDIDIARLYKYEFNIKKVGNYLFITNFPWQAKLNVMPKFKNKK